MSAVGGVERGQEISSASLYRDTKRPLQKFFPWIRQRYNAAVIIFMSVPFMVFAPAFSELIFLFVVLPVFLISYKAKPDHLFRLPKHSNMIDHKDLNPVGKMQQARGVFFLGNERNTNKELWAAATDIQTHMMILGTTGSGKSFSLTSLTINSLNYGSSFVCSDAKGQNTLWTREYTFAKRYGRLDDMLIIVVEQ